MALDTPAPVLEDAERDLLDETVDAARQMLQGFALGEIAEPNPGLVARLNALRDRLVERESAVYLGAGSTEVRAADVAAATQDTEATDLEPLFAETLDSITADVVSEPVVEAEPVAEAAPEPEPEPAPEPEPEPAPEVVADLVTEPEPQPELAPVLIAGADTIFAAEVAATESAISDQAAQSSVAETAPGDDLDADLLPVFLEE
eukprot:gene4963-6589_t